MARQLNLQVREPALHKSSHLTEKPALECTPHSPQLEKAHMQQQRPRTPKNKQIDTFFKNNTWITNKDITQGSLLNVVWQPGWEGSLGENGYMCMYG